MSINFIIVAALGCGVAACGGKQTENHSEPVDTSNPHVAETRDAAVAEAVNEDEVVRYEDEVAVDRDPLTVKVPLAIAFNSYPKGDVIATLRRDDEVVRLSERHGFYRVTFPDPGNPSQKVMGWVAHFAFEELPPIQKKLAIPRCTIGTGHPGTVLVVLEDPPRCAYVCKEAAECAATGTRCEARIVVPRSGEITASPSYTTVCTAPPEADVDPGIPDLSLFGTRPPRNGKCPNLFTLAPKLGRLCYRHCKTDIQCPEGSTCRAFGKTKLCAADWHR